MKNIVRNLLLLFLGINIAIPCLSQDASSFEPSLELTTKKNSDDTRIFKAVLIGEGEENLPIIGADIKFYNIAENEKTEIGMARTDKNGIAILKVKSNYQFNKELGGIINIAAEFAGSEALSGLETLVSFKDVKLIMELADVDSVKTIFISATYLSETGEEIPISEVDILFFIDGIFNRLPIGDGYLENGKCSFEFPTYLKGDFEGNLSIYAAFVDHEDFASVEKKANKKWGTHTANYIEPTRELWTSGAPLWMIFTLSILLIGVWSHYLYAVIQLLLIRKEGKKISKVNDI